MLPHTVMRETKRLRAIGGPWWAIRDDQILQAMLNASKRPLNAADILVVHPIIDPWLSAHRSMPARKKYRRTIRKAT